MEQETLVPEITPPVMHHCIDVLLFQFPLTWYWYSTPAATQAGPEMDAWENPCMVEKHNPARLIISVEICDSLSGIYFG